MTQHHPIISAISRAAAKHAKFQELIACKTIDLVPVVEWMDMPAPAPKPTRRIPKPRKRKRK